MVACSNSNKRPVGRQLPKKVPGAAIIHSGPLLPVLVAVRTICHPYSPPRQKCMLARTWSPLKSRNLKDLRILIHRDLPEK